MSRPLTGTLQRAWDGDGPGMAEVLVERLRAAGVEIDDSERWTVEAAARRPRSSPTSGRCGAIGGAIEQELADTGTTDHDGTIIEATDATRRRPDLLPWRHVIVDEYQDVNPAQAAFVHALTTPKGPGPGGEGATRLAGDLRVPGGQRLADSDGGRSGRGRADALRTDHVELGPTATPTTAAVLAAFAYWIDRGVRPRRRRLAGDPGDYRERGPAPVLHHRPLPSTPLLPRPPCGSPIPQAGRYRGGDPFPFPAEPPPLPWSYADAGRRNRSAKGISGTSRSPDPVAVAEALAPATVQTFARPAA